MNARGILLTIGTVMMTVGALLKLADDTTSNHTDGKANTASRPLETSWHNEKSPPPAAAPATTARPVQPTRGDPVHYLYHTIASGLATGCALFSPTAAQQFASHFHAPNCPAATQQLHSQVTDEINYGSTGERLPGDYLGDTMTISSCTIKPAGGPPLGRFTLRRTNDGWYISGHDTEPC